MPAAPFATNPDFYPVGQTENSEEVAYITTLKAAGVKNFGVIYCAEAPTCSQSVGELRGLSKQYGPPLVYTGSISATAPNYTAQCVAAKQDNIAAVIVEDASTVEARVASDCVQQGYTPIYVEGGSAYQPFLTTSPGVDKNQWLEFNDLPDFVNAPGVKAMDDAVDKYYPGLRANSHLWEETAAWQWPSGILLEDAVKAGGLGASSTPSASEIIKGLESLKGDTLQGWSPPLTFAAGKPHPVNCWFTVRIQNGVQSLSNGGHLTCKAQA